MAAPEDHNVPTPWMSLQQAAAYAAWSVRTIRRLIAAGELPAYLSGKRGLRVRREDVDKLMKPL